MYNIIVIAINSSIVPNMKDIVNASVKFTVVQLSIGTFFNRFRMYFSVRKRMIVQVRIKSRDKKKAYISLRGFMVELTVSCACL